MTDRDLADHPYAPPSTDEAPPQPAPPPPAPRRIAGPKVYGILSIVFGGLVLLMTLISTGFTAGAQSQMMKGLIAHDAADKQAVHQALDRYMDAVRLQSYATSIVFIAMSLLLGMTGIGQLKYKAWARSLSLVWASVALLCLVAIGAIYAISVSPAVQQFYDTLARAAPSGSPAAAMQKMMGSIVSGPAMLVMTLLFYAPYPILLLIYFSRAKAKAAMTA